jgi:hypothetical protein
MALPGETLDSGAPDRCEDCGSELVARACGSSAGSYIGSCCRCGPYSRDSGYFATRDEAEAMLAAQPAEYAHSTELAAEPRPDVAKLRHHLEVLADALAAPGNAPLGQKR